MSLSLEQERIRQANQRAVDLFTASVALIRERKVRVLNLLTPEKMQKREYRKPATLLLKYYGAIIREINSCKQTCMMILEQHPDFNVETHYGKIIRGDDSEVTLLAVPIDNCPEDLRIVRDQWDTVMLRTQQLIGYIDELDVYADAMWDLTAQVIIQKTEDHARRPYSYGVHEDAASEIADAFDAFDRATDSGGEEEA